VIQDANRVAEQLFGERQTFDEERELVRREREANKIRTTWLRRSRVEHMKEVAHLKSEIELLKRKLAEREI